jgi:hypothetical protein
MIGSNLQIGEGRDRELLHNAETFCYKETSTGPLLAHVYDDKLNAAPAKPLLIFFHGGFWDTPAISQFATQALHFMGRGCVSILAETRVKSKHQSTPLDAVEDAMELIIGTKKHTELLGVDPKKIILVVDDTDELQKSKSLKFRLDRMYPLVKYKVFRDELVKRKEKKPLVNELLVSHQLNKSNFLLKQKKFTKNDSIMFCGSMPISHQKKSFDKKFGKVPYEYDLKSELIQKIKAFNNFIDLCAKNDIQLIVALPPNFRVISNGFENRMKHFVGTKGVVWKYEQSKPDYSDSDNFFDNAHLQKKGAVIYTADLIAYLKTAH